MTVRDTARTYKYRVFPSPHLLSEPLSALFDTEKGSDFRQLRSLLPSQWQVLLMGGVLRDLALDSVRQHHLEPADIDLVIVGASSIEQIRKHLGNMRHSRNSFGGIKCQFRQKGVIFDIWRMEDHPNMSTAPTPHTIEQLLRRNLLDIDALVWDAATDSLHDFGCLEAVREGRIGLLGPDGIDERFMAAQAAHAISVAVKTEFIIHDDVREFIAAAFEQCGREAVLDIVERKMPYMADQLGTCCNDLLKRGVQKCQTPARTSPRKKSSSLLNTRP